MGSSSPAMISLVSSAIGMASDMQQSKDPGTRTSGRYEDLKAEREAQEAEQAEREAEERKRERTKITEAREVERKRKLAATKGKTTLLNRSIGLIEDPEVDVSRLKHKFGE